VCFTLINKYVANINIIFETTSKKQRNMMFYTKNMQINEKKDALPSRKRSASE